MLVMIIYIDPHPLRHAGAQSHGVAHPTPRVWVRLVAQLGLRLEGWRGGGPDATSPSLARAAIAEADRESQNLYASTTPLNTSTLTEPLVVNSNIQQGADVHQELAPYVTTVSTMRHNCHATNISNINSTTEHAYQCQWHRFLHKGGHQS